MKLNKVGSKLSLKTSGLVLFFIALLFSTAQAQQNLPELGAEIYLEPGQTKGQVDKWVKLLSDNKMPVARVFMMWNYLEPKPGEWDFTLYDELFKAAQKYNVKITATLVPNSPPFHWGKPFFYVTHTMLVFEKEEYRERSENYIKQVVERYKDNPALDSWWLYNEPSASMLPDTFAVNEFKKFLKIKYVSIDSLNKSWQSFFPSFEAIAYDSTWQKGGWVWQTAYYDWNNFWNFHLNNQIGWLGAVVRKYDKNHSFHSNPPGLLTSLAHYDLAGMKKNLNSMGASMHPSWAFSFVPRNKYGLTVSWQNNLLYGVADQMPYWISELQAGNNLASGLNPMCPSPKDIAQWVWSSFGSGAKRVIFWLLNARMQGNESAEWALLDFQQKPSERMLKSLEIANVIQQNRNDFESAKPVKSPITIIVSPQTLLMQERKQNNYSTIEAVKSLSHQKAAMACYNALMEQGIPVQVRLNTEFDWRTKEKNQVVILPDVLCLTTADIAGIETFVLNGNKIIATGLTGLYDQQEKSWVVNREFPLAKVFGGDIKEIFAESESFKIKLNKYKNAFPVQLWYTQILPGTGKVIGLYQNKPIAIRNNYGNGEVLWIPSMICMGAWANSSTPLANLLQHETSSEVKKLPFHFEAYHEDCFMHTLKTSDGYITIVVNGNGIAQKIGIVSSAPRSSTLLYGKGWNAAKRILNMEPGETVVLKWK
ncbi:MAG: beta-galactosidase [Mucilaginibacter sp.]|nr:beta-galactosidase [Mucilaginibacter sp.]